MRWHIHSDIPGVPDFPVAVYYNLRDALDWQQRNEYTIGTPSRVVYR